MAPIPLTLWLRLLLTGDLELSESQSTQDLAVGGKTKLQQRVWSPGTAGQARVPPMPHTCLLEPGLSLLPPASAVEDTEAYGRHRLTVGKPNMEGL